MRPRLGQTYRAGDLPARSVVQHGTDTAYVVGTTGLCMRWEQPIPLSEDWRVEYVGRLAFGWMTPREVAEVDETAEEAALLGPARDRRCPLR